MCRPIGTRALIWWTLLSTTTFQSMLWLTNKSWDWATMPLTSMNGRYWDSCEMCWQWASCYNVATMLQPCCVWLINISGLEGCNPILLVWNPQPCHGYPSHGLHWQSLHDRHAQPAALWSSHLFCSWTFQEHSQQILLDLVLHPCYKLDYFKQAKWQAEWINTTHELVHATYRSSYAPRHIQDDIEPSLDSEACEGEVSLFPWLYQHTNSHLAIKHALPTSLTTFPVSTSSNWFVNVTNSTAILQLARKMLLQEMHSNGGMINIQSIHNFHAWCSIIWPSLVCPIFLFICHANAVYL